jgi:hypothetical protein
MMRIVACTIVIFLAVPTTAISEAPPLKPWMPCDQRPIAAGAVAAGVVMQVPNSQAAAIPLIHLTASQPGHALNHLKGDFGEWVMDAVMTKQLLRVTGGWSIATAARTGRSGIDGLYFKADSAGHFHDLLVADAKYGSATLGVLKDGTKQMSRDWIKPHLGKTARMYRAMANEVDLRNASLVKGTERIAAANRITIPLSERASAEIWRTSGGLRYFCADKTVSPRDIQRQLNRAAEYLDEAVAGKAGYRPRLFSYKSSGRQHVFAIATLDDDANVISSRQVKGAYEQLPVEYQKTVRSQVRRTLLAAGKSRNEVRVLTDGICRNAEQFNYICMQPAHSYLAGLDARAFAGAGVVGAASMGIDALVQVWAGGEVDVGRVVTTGGLATGSAVVGNYVGVQTSQLLTRYSPLLGQYGGPILGGIVGGSVFSYGLYAAGYSDARAAHTGAIVSVGAAALTPVAAGLAYNGAMAIALSYGTAGTGVAVSSLSGAAATNAAAAWLGGGTVASGGGGAAAAGGSILVTGGTAVIVVVAAVAIERTVHYALYFKDVADQNRYLTTIVDYTRSRVLDGQQQEWQHGPLTP